jgi:ribonuclease PH
MTKTTSSRTRTRKADQLRSVTIERYPTAAAGSVMIQQGNTRVLCTASIDTQLPPFLKPKDGAPPTQGWVTAEYNMLPGSTQSRKKRGTDSRGTEIQRLIGRVLRQAVDLEKMPGLSITCDCDVIVADGGTRTASITGAMVALADALALAREQGLIQKDPIKSMVAAVSVGIIDGVPTLDLDYPLDVRAETDLNVAMDSRGRFVEVQGTAEREAFSRKEMDRMLDLAAKGIRKLIAIQKKVIASRPGN